MFIVLLNWFYTSRRHDTTENCTHFSRARDATTARLENEILYIFMLCALCYASIYSRRDSYK